LKVEGFVARRTKHGRSASPEYAAWLYMKSRCRNNLYYVRKGIAVSPLWEHDFEAFVAYVGTMPGPGYVLDRIDNAKGYEPGNVRWATKQENARNKSNRRELTVRGQTKPLKDWAEKFGLSVATIYARLKRGLSEEEAVLAPNRRPRPASL
jgi:hypothetical protein